MRRFCFSFLILVVGCCALAFCLVTCKAHGKKQEVVEWLKRVPQSAEDARKWGAVPYDTDEQWADAGRKIDGLETTLIGLLQDPPREMLTGNEGPRTSDLAHALCYVGSTRSLDVLIRVMEDTKRPEPTRVFSACALGHIGNPLAVDSLRKIVGSREEPLSLRINAVSVLEMLGDPNATPVIEEFLEDPQLREGDRAFAGQVLEKLRKKQETGPK